MQLPKGNFFIMKILRVRQLPGLCHTNHSNYGTIIRGLTGHISQGTRNGGVLLWALEYVCLHKIRVRETTTLGLINCSFYWQLFFMNWNQNY